MNHLKFAAHLFLGLLLFICLLALGPAVALKATVLNTNFVANRLNGLDIVALIGERLPDFESSPYLPDDIEEALQLHTDDLKQAALEVVTETHRYLVSGGSFDLTETVRAGLFRRELGASIIADVDLKPAAREAIQEIVPPSISGYILAPYLEAAVPTVAHWLEGQLTDILMPAYDYIFSPAPQVMVINIDLEVITEEVRLIVKEAFLQAPPPEAAGIPPAILALAFDLGWSALGQDIPATLAIDLSKALGQPGGMAKTLSEADEILREVRLWTGRCQAGFVVLATLTAILVVAVVATNRCLAASFLTLGLSFTCAGLISLGGGLLGQQAGRAALVGRANISDTLETWLLGIAGDLFRPFFLLAAAFILIGGLLLAARLFAQKRAS